LVLANVLLRDNAASGSQTFAAVHGKTSPRPPSNPHDLPGPGLNVTLSPPTAMSDGFGCPSHSRL